MQLKPGHRWIKKDGQWYQVPGSPKPKSFGTWQDNSFMPESTTLSEKVYNILKDEFDNVDQYFEFEVKSWLLSKDDIKQNIIKHNLKESTFLLFMRLLYAHVLEEKAIIKT